MKSKPLNIMLLLLGAALLVTLGILTKLFVIGEPVDGAQLHCDASVNGSTLELRVDTVESAMALRGWNLKQDGNTLQIRARKVLVSPLFSDGSYQASIDLEGIKTISLGGTVIWSAEK